MNQIIDSNVIHLLYVSHSLMDTDNFSKFQSIFGVVSLLCTVFLLYCIQMNTPKKMKEFSVLLKFIVVVDLYAAIRTILCTSRLSSSGYEYTLHLSGICSLYSTKFCAILHFLSISAIMSTTFLFVYVFFFSYYLVNGWEITRMQIVNACSVCCVAASSIGMDAIYQTFQKDSSSGNEISYDIPGATEYFAYTYMVPVPFILCTGTVLLFRRWTLTTLKERPIKGKRSVVACAAMTKALHIYLLPIFNGLLCSFFSCFCLSHTILLSSASGYLISLPMIIHPLTNFISIIFVVKPYRIFTKALLSTLRKRMKEELERFGSRIHSIGEMFPRETFV